MPVFVIPGNHDARAPLRAAFRDAGYLPRDGFLHYAIDDYPVRLIGLDTLVPDKHFGALCGERLGWLDRRAGGAAEPADRDPDASSAICDRDRFHGPRPLRWRRRVCRDHRPPPQVERILCGHLHRAIDRRFAGTVAGTAPSTAHQIRLDLAPEARLSFVFEPPGYQLHLWRDGGLVSHTAVFGDWPGPLPVARRSPAGLIRGLIRAIGPVPLAALRAEPDRRGGNTCLDAAR